MELCDHNKCTGCCTCYSVCPHHAIQFRSDESGALYPVIDANACVECGLCRMVCPALTQNVISSNSVQKCFAAWSTDKQLIENAASAGVVTTLACHIIRNGGTAFGVKLHEKQLVFTGATSVNEYLKCQGSRYVHAFAGDVYTEVKQKLDEGVMVMFTGTPCQIHGLRQYLQKDYENLLAVDLVCHGVAPITYLNEYLQGKGIDDYDNVVFRGKNGMSMVASLGEDVLYRKYKLVDIFYTAYLKGLISRENCYQCPYASTQRYGDLTVGDFWGLERTAEMPNHRFISVVLCNTAKGERFLKDCGNSIRYVERPLEMALKKNGQLNGSCSRHPGRDRFLSLYPQHGLVKSIKRTSLYPKYLKSAIQYRALFFASKTKQLILHGT
ncbi:MAG: Coenzyme F420 hydrogenase/dehydrogenase, beta subunit C-terminal domain [Muribaculaceae bacterium]|nr:Coenzyme F420 hydrogenase/dehydrogenase, beta subunit C-terminal domain [Muribaculaceae bacterium]